MAKEPKIVPFGKYELLEKIAVGGMAEIFKARTKGVGGFEKYLAIKRILPHLSENKDFIDMLINEAKIAVMLSHANIVQIYDLGKIDDSYFIAMEYIEGKDLRALMSRCDQIGMPLFIQHAIFIAIEVCKGLEYAHAKASQDASGPRELNIVHRDISPQNVMISYEGEVKITDFGIAKANVNISETEAGVVKGKYEYMSPEQASGLPVDRRTDIFSTGIVLYEMLTGQKPFRGESDLTILERVREAKVEPPSKYNKSTPKKLEKIVLKSLAKEPEDRYQTATELKDDLTRFFYSSTFNFTTSNLAAFMKSIFAEEIKLDVLSDSTGIGKRPDLEEGRTVSRIFGRPDSDRFSPKNRNGGAPLGAITTDSTNVGASRSGTEEIGGGREPDPASSSRELGGEPLASIEDEINRILIPGRTNAGRPPAAAAKPPDSSAPSATVEAFETGTSGGETGSRTAPIPANETGSRATVATPRPVTSSGMLLGGEVESAAMELAMEIEMAMPPIRPAGAARPEPKPDDDEEEAPTEAGRGAAAYEEDVLRADQLSDDRPPPRRPSGPEAELAADARPGGSGWESVPGGDRETRTSASGREAVRLEATEPDPEDAPSPDRQSTMITGPGGPAGGARTGTGAVGVRSAPDGAKTEAPRAAGRATGTGSLSKVPVRAVRERVRGVTVNQPDASAARPHAERTAERDRETPSPDAAPAEPLRETVASVSMPRGETSAGTTGSSGESTLIGRAPEPPTLERVTATSASGRPAPRSEPSVTGSRTPPPNRGADRDTRPSSPRGGVTRLGPAGEGGDIDRETSGTFVAASPAREASRRSPPRKGPVREPAPSSFDDQADLYPDLADGKRGAHPLLLVAGGALVFLAGVIIAKML